MEFLLSPIPRYPNANHFFIVAETTVTETVAPNMHSPYNIYDYYYFFYFFVLYTNIES